ILTLWGPRFSPYGDAVNLSRCFYSPSILTLCVNPQLVSPTTSRYSRALLIASSHGCFFRIMGIATFSAVGQSREQVKRLLYVEPLRRRMRVRFGGNWIADSENVLLLFEPGHYPVAYFPETYVSPNTLQSTAYT